MTFWGLRYIHHWPTDIRNSNGMQLLYQILCRWYCNISLSVWEMFVFFSKQLPFNFAGSALSSFNDPNIIWRLGSNYSKTLLISHELGFCSLNISLNFRAEDNLREWDRTSWWQSSFSSQLSQALFRVSINIVTTMTVMIIWHFFSWHPVPQRRCWWYQQGSRPGSRWHRELLWKDLRWDLRGFQRKIVFDRILVICKW